MCWVVASVAAVSHLASWLPVLPPREAPLLRSQPQPVPHSPSQRQSTAHSRAGSTATSSDIGYCARPADGAAPVRLPARPLRRLLPHHPLPAGQRPGVAARAGRGRPWRLPRPAPRQNSQLLLCRAAGAGQAAQAETAARPALPPAGQPDGRVGPELPVQPTVLLSQPDVLHVAHNAPPALCPLPLLPPAATPALPPAGPPVPGPGTGTQFPAAPPALPAALLPAQCAAVPPT